MNPEDVIPNCDAVGFFATHIAKPHTHKLFIILDENPYEVIFTSEPDMQERIANG